MNDKSADRPDVCPTCGRSWPEGEPRNPTARVLEFPETQKKPPPKRGLVERDDYGG